MIQQTGAFSGFSGITALKSSGPSVRTEPPATVEAAKPVSNPSAFEGQINNSPPPLGASTAKEEICGAVDTCENPDDSVPGLDSESTGMEGQELDGDFAESTGEVSGESSETSESSESSETSESSESSETSESSESSETSESSESSETSESSESSETSESSESSETSESSESSETSESSESSETSESSESSETSESSESSESSSETSSGAEAHVAQAAPAATEGAQTEDQGQSDSGVKPASLTSIAATVGKLGTSASKIGGAVNAVTHNVDHGVLGPKSGASAAPATTVGKGAANLNQGLSTAKNVGTLLDGELTAADAGAAAGLTGDAARLLQNKGTTGATQTAARVAQVGQTLGQVAKVGSLVGNVVTLGSKISNGELTASVAQAAQDPSAENLSTVANNAKVLTSAVDGVVTSAKGASATMDAIHVASAARTAATTTGKVALRAAETGAHVAASATRAAGRFAPGVNVALAVVDTAVAGADVAKAIKNPTTDNIVNAAFSSITAAGSIAAASNVPVVSQVGAAVSVVSDTAKLVYNNRAAIASAASSAATTVTRAASSAATTVTRAASSAATTVTRAASSAATTVTRAASSAATTVTNAASSAYNAASSAASSAASTASSAASSAYSWAKSWF
jgi:trimeric autotransporter adhesin